MLVRFGFVAMSMNLENASPSRTLSFKNYTKIAKHDPKAAAEKLTMVARENLRNSLRLLRYCKAHNVKVYRFSSKIIPLATHPELARWDYLKDLRPQLIEIGAFVKENKMRVSFHPDHYTLINSPREKVFESSLADLDYHCSILKVMTLDERAKLVIHIGGSYHNKEKSLDKFIKNWSLIPENIAGRITIENDDKIYTAEDALYLCQKLHLPMVLDIHHFRCNHKKESNMGEIYSRCISTWKGTGLPPKIHVSSPKSENEPRSHHDYIDPETVYSFLMAAREHKADLDVMVEAKQKDKAMFRLVQELSRMPGVELINDTGLKII